MYIRVLGVGGPVCSRFPVRREAHVGSLRVPTADADVTCTDQDSRVQYAVPNKDAYEQPGGPDIVEYNAVGRKSGSIPQKSYQERHTARAKLAEVEQ